MSVTAIILAAGQGTRMKSSLPKVLHKAAGKPMVQWVIDALQEAGVEEKIAVLGHGGDMVEDVLRGQVQVAWQHEQLGTGHAVMQAIPELENAEKVVVLCGDAPLLSSNTLKEALKINAIYLLRLSIFIFTMLYANIQQNSCWAPTTCHNR